MSNLRGLGPLTRAGLLQAFRSPTSLFWNLVFPLIWLFLFGFIFFRSATDKVLMMPGLFTITIMSGAFFSVSYLMVRERESGILRRYRATPVSPTVIVLANGIRAIVTMLLAITMQASVGWVVFRYQVDGSLLLTVLVLLIGAAAFVPLGLFVGSVAQDMRSAPAITNLLFFPLVFGSGATLPAFMLPGWAQSASRLIPSSYLVESLDGVMVRGYGLAELAGPGAVLFATMGVGLWANSRMFRWESSEPVDRRSLLVTVAVIAAVYVVAALAAPSFQMAHPPARG